ncbi:MAG: uracil-xanthine permease [Ruminococcaceae bacterium]|nr:uracil-xanthine permease [Oscillospiraceae bacterium]
MKLIYGITDKPKFGQLIVFALQQLLAIMAATLVVPVIVGHGMQPAAALFGAGMGTLVYVLFTRGKSPVFLGSSFAFIGSMSAAFAGAVSMQAGYAGILIGAGFAGLVYVVIALVVKFAGVAWINKIMPAVVIGPTVAIIGLSLAGNAVGDLTKVNYVAPVDAALYQVVEVDEIGGDGTLGTSLKVFTEDGVNCPGIAIQANEDGTYALSQTTGSPYVALICGLITLFVTMICSSYGKKMVKLIPFIIGIIAGYLAATIFYFIGKATGNAALMIINFAPFAAMESMIAVPDFTFLTAMKGFAEIDASYIGTIAAAYVPVAFVVFAEHIADHKNLSSIIEQDLLENPGLHRTLLGDGVGSIVGAIFGGCPNTTYGESVGCVAITKNASVATIIAAAIGALLISFITPFVAFVNTIPSCVMGGVCMALYGFIAVSGLKMIKNVDLEQNKNLFVVSVILIAGIGGLVLQIGAVTITSIACALILGILVNLLLSKAQEN